MCRQKRFFIVLPARSSESYHRGLICRYEGRYGASALPVQWIETIIQEDQKEQIMYLLQCLKRTFQENMTLFVPILGEWYDSERGRLITIMETPMGTPLDVFIQSIDKQPFQEETIGILYNQWRYTLSAILALFQSLGTLSLDILLTTNQFIVCQDNSLRFQLNPACLENQLVAFRGEGAEKVLNSNSSPEKVQEYIQSFLKQLPLHQLPRPQTIVSSAIKRVETTCETPTTTVSSFQKNRSMEIRRVDSTCDIPNAAICGSQGDHSPNSECIPIHFNTVWIFLKNNSFFFLSFHFIIFISIMDSYKSDLTAFKQEKRLINCLSRLFLERTMCCD